ncbi:MAG TPA: polysaccharide biosynthesis tyrosine autokinase [Candidatus Limnocylindria bacterium]|jgi:capsular exopolysaccharide synthesis family protein|nr:polysaccharide biosynthesis tyrosine autokinase [Candidatus Limnocylindria bacterium]
MDEQKQVALYGNAQQIERRGPRGSDVRVVEIPDSYELLEPDEAFDVRSYVRILRKRLATILIVFFVLFTVALIVTLKQRPVYRAQVLLEIQKENPDIPTIKELYELEEVSDAYLRTQYSILGSESLARRIIDQLQLESLPEFNSRKWWQLWPITKKSSPRQVFAVGPMPESRDRELSQRVLERFQDRLTIDPISRSRLVAVRFDSRDAELAARLANTLAEDYIDQNLEGRWQATEKAGAWLSQQLVGVKSRLEKSEDELQSYARRNGLVFLETDKGTSENVVNQRMHELQEQLTKAQAERYEKEALYHLVQTSDAGALPGVFDNKLIQDLSERLAELKRELAQLSTTFNPEYPKAKEIQSQIDEIKASLREERQRAADRIVNDYSAAVRRESLVKHALEEEQKEVSLIAEKSVQYNILKREVDTNRQLYEGLLQQLKSAGISAGLRASNIRIVDSAEPPAKPVKPKTLLNLAVAMFLGLGLGIGGALFQERMDDTLKGDDDVERLFGLPSLALIPVVPPSNGDLQGIHRFLPRDKALMLKGNGAGKNSRSFWHRIDRDGTQHAALVEAFRSLRTSVLLSTPDRPPSSLLVTSAQPAEGKTTVACNLAISLGQLGHRVLLLDADLRFPSLHKLFGTSGSLGLVSYLTGQEDWRAVVRPSGSRGLDLLVCGPVPPNPSELLSSQSMGALIRSASAEYSFIILDSSPMLALADSRILAPLVNGVLLVVKSGTTPREQLMHAQSGIRSVGGNMIGVVLNNVDIRTNGYYNYGQYGPIADPSSHETVVTVNFQMPPQQKASD